MDAASALPVSLSDQEQSVLRGLLASAGRVVSRRELARRAGLSEMSERRCDSILVAVRRALPTDAIVTVRGRGWMLQQPAISAAIILLETTSN
jgi:DNA-binding response OmpR family regulator